MLSAYVHLRLLPQVWRRLVNSAGQKFQTSTISIGNHMISSTIWDKSARVNFSKANQIARARRASAICSLHCLGLILGFWDFGFGINFLHCLGLIDVLSANELAEIFTCVLLYRKRKRHSLRLTLTPVAYTCFELSAKIDLSFPFGVAVNSLLSIT